MMGLASKILFGLWLGMAWVSAYSGPPASGEGRPENAIYDPAGLISPAGKNALIREANSIRESSGLDLLVVVIEQLNGWEPQALAEDLANRWGYHGGRALILWLPDGSNENPWIAVSGMVRNEISSAKLDAMVLRAKSQARSDQRFEEALRRAVVSLGEDLRFAAGGAARKVEPEAKMPRIRTMDAVLILVRDSRKVAVAGLVGLGLLLGLVYALIRIVQRVRMALIPRKFPDVSWKRRFGAPHGGIVYTSSFKKRQNR
jgi:hypothetical protein